MKIIGSKGSVEMSLEMMQRSFERYLDPFHPLSRLKFMLKHPTPQSVDTWEQMCAFLQKELGLDGVTFLVIIYCLKLHMVLARRSFGTVRLS